MHRWYEPAGWQPWESVGVTIDGDPVACSWGRDRIDLDDRDLRAHAPEARCDAAPDPAIPGDDKPLPGEP